MTTHPTPPVAGDAIEVIELRSDWHITCLARGHVDPQAMRDAVAKERSGDVTGFCEPRHEWWRRYPKWEDGMRVPWYSQAEPHARGAFRCTVMVKDW